MRFTQEFNNYISSLSPEDRERELERVGYYAAGHGRPRRPNHQSVGNPFSYTENMGSSMVNEAGAGFQNMASGGSGYSSPSRPSTGQPQPISEFRDNKDQALKSGMQRFGMSADALRNIAKTVGIRRLDSSNDLKMIQDHFDKNPKSNPGNQGTSTVDVFGPGPGSPGGRDTYSPGRRPGDYDGGRYGEFYSDLPDNTGYGGGSSYGGYGRGSSGRGRGRVMSPEELGIAPGQRGGRYGGIGRKNKGRGERGVSTVDVFGPGRRPGKNKGFGGRGVSTDDVFGGRRRGARNRAQSFIK